MAQCAICNDLLEAGPWNKHHRFFPKTKKEFKKANKHTTKLKMHVSCHDKFHIYFYANCVNSEHRSCDCCMYGGICTYNASKLRKQVPVTA